MVQKVAYGLTFVLFGIVKLHTRVMKPSLSTSKRLHSIVHKQLLVHDSQFPKSWLIALGAASSQAPHFYCESH